MAKQDYKSTSIRDRYRTLVKQMSLPKFKPEKNEVRGRAELLDMLEEMFESKEKHITAESIRAFLSILVKSTKNSSDDR